jgi:hypothetical protein
MSDIVIAVIMLLVFANGFLFGLVFSQHLRSVETAKAAQKIDLPPMTAEEAERVRKEREAMKAEQDAFLSMMGYNADIAYGKDDNPLEGS